MEIEKNTANCIDFIKIIIKLMYNLLINPLVSNLFTYFVINLDNLMNPLFYKNKNKYFENTSFVMFVHIKVDFDWIQE